MKAWPCGLPVGMLGDLQALFSSVIGRNKFTFHIWILGPSKVCAVSWGMITFFIWILGLSEVCTHKHSHDHINNDNDDKTLDVEILVKSDNVEVEELFEDDEDARWQGNLSRENPYDHVSLSDEESADAKKELDTIDNKFDVARVAKLKCSQKQHERSQLIIFRSNKLQLSVIMILKLI